MISGKAPETRRRSAIHGIEILTYLINGTRSFEEEGGEALEPDPAALIVFAGVVTEYGKILSSNEIIGYPSSRYVRPIRDPGRTVHRRSALSSLRDPPRTTGTMFESKTERRGEKERQERRGNEGRTGERAGEGRQRLSFILAASCLDLSKRVPAPGCFRAPAYPALPPRSSRDREIFDTSCDAFVNSPTSSD